MKRLVPTGLSFSALVFLTFSSSAQVTTGGTTICSGSTSATLTVSGFTGSVIKWQYAAPPFTSWIDIANTNTTYTSGTLTQTRAFRGVVQNGTGPLLYADSTIVQVTPPTDGGTISAGSPPSSGCGWANHGTLDVLVDVTVSILRWESSVAPFTSWTTISNTTTTYNPGTVTQTTRFRVVVQNGICSPVASAYYEIAVGGASSGGTVSGGGSVCTGSNSGTLTLSGHNGSVVKWQSSVSPFTSWSDISNTSTTYTSGALSQTTQFRAVVQSGTCTAANSAATTVSVAAAAVGGSISGSSTVCSGSGSGTLTLSGYTGAITKWQSSVSPFTSWTDIANTSNTYSSGALTQTTQFRAMVGGGSCSSVSSGVATTTVTSTPTGGAVTGGSTICTGSSSGTLTLNGYTGTVSRWQSSVSPFTSWTDITNTSTTYSSGALTQTTQFRAVVSAGTCTSNSSSTTVTVSGSGVSAGTVSGGSTVCQGSTSGTLTLSGHSGTIVKWQSAVSPFSSWTDIANTATTYTSGALNVATRFRAVVQSGACTNISGEAQVNMILTGAGGGSIFPSAPGSGTCGSYNPGTLNVTWDTAFTILRWESAIAPFTSWTSIANTTTALTPGTLTQTTRFRMIVQNGSCPAAVSATFDATVMGTGSWLGTTSSNWNTSANWCGGTVPNASTNVVINAGAPNNPVINTAAMVNNLIINPGATLAFTGSGNSIDVHGTLTPAGTFNTTGGRVTFGSLAAQTIPGLQFDQLYISGGAKTLTGNVTVDGSLALTSGVVSLDAYNLTIGASGSISGASSSSFIVTNNTGTLVQNNIGSTGKTASILFPVGVSSTSYTPVTIQNAGTTDHFSVRVINNVYEVYSATDGSPTSALYANDAVAKTWYINETTSGGSSATLTFQWNAADELPGFNRSASKVCNYNGLGLAPGSGPWVWGPVGAASGSSPYTRSMSGVSTFASFNGKGQFAIGYGSTPLPVVFTTFAATLQNRACLISWSTASEINTTRFEIESSANGRGFTKVGEVRAVGGRNNSTRYTFTDQRVAELFLRSKVAYYRIKSVDVDGRADYTRTVTVASENARSIECVSVGPNPFSETAQMQFVTTEPSETQITITDILGKQVTKETISTEAGLNVYEISGVNLGGRGVYYVTLVNRGHVMTIKVIWQ